MLHYFVQNVTVHLIRREVYWCTNCHGLLWQRW